MLILYLASYAADEAPDTSPFSKIKSENQPISNNKDIVEITSNQKKKLLK